MISRRMSGGKKKALGNRCYSSLIYPRKNEQAKKNKASQTILIPSLFKVVENAKCKGKCRVIRHVLRRDDVVRMNGVGRGGG